MPQLEEHDEGTSGQAARVLTGTVQNIGEFAAAAGTLGLSSIISSAFKDEKRRKAILRVQDYINSIYANLKEEITFQNQRLENLEDLTSDMRTSARAKELMLAEAREKEEAKRAKAAAKAAAGAALRPTNPLFSVAQDELSTPQATSDEERRGSPYLSRDGAPTRRIATINTQLRPGGGRGGGKDRGTKSKRNKKNKTKRRKKTKHKKTQRNKKTKRR